MRAIAASEALGEIMKISTLFKVKKPVISFEIFPPKGEFNTETVNELLSELCPLSPDFISVTYGAGGSSNKKQTEEIASIVKDKFHIDSISHLTCINSTKEEVAASIKSLTNHKVENVLALRGDRIADSSAKDFSHASELIPLLVDGGFCVGAACYPEGHIESVSIEQDISYMKLKEDLGASFFVSQLYFNNQFFYRFIDKARAIGIKSPVTAGIMPILSKAQVSRMIFMCGTSLPAEIVKLLYKYENDPVSLRSAGIEYASKQILDLLQNGVDGVHIYTMNQPAIASGHLNYLKANGYERR